MKCDEIVHADFACANAVKQFFNFSFGSFEVELAKGHLGPAHRIADSPLQLLSATFALGVAEFLEGTTQFLALQSG